MKCARILPLALGTLLLGVAFDAAADTAPQITVGDRIKVETALPPRIHIGALDDRALCIRPSVEGAPIEIPCADIAALSASTGNRSLPRSSRRWEGSSGWCSIRATAGAGCRSRRSASRPT